MLREELIKIIGEYTTTEYSWLDVPWCFSALIVVVSVYALFRVLGFVLRGI